MSPRRYEKHPVRLINLHIFPKAGNLSTAATVKQFTRTAKPPCFSQQHVEILIKFRKRFGGFHSIQYWVKTADCLTHTHTQPHGEHPCVISSVSRALITAFVYPSARWLRRCLLAVAHWVQMCVCASTLSPPVFCYIMKIQFRLIDVIPSKLISCHWLPC